MLLNVIVESPLERGCGHGREGAEEQGPVCSSSGGPLNPRGFSTHSAGLMVPPLWVVPSPPRSFCHLPIAPPAGDQASAQASRDRVSWFFCFVLFYWGFFFLVFRSRQGFCIALAVLELNVDQADLELRNPPASASQVLGLKVCATTAQLVWFFVCLFCLFFVCKMGMCLDGGWHIYRS